MHDRVTSASRKKDVARRTPGPERHRRRRASRAVAVTLGVAGALVLPSLLVGATTATANVTIIAQDLQGNPISDFTFLVSEDNAARRTDPPSQRPGVKPTPSYIPLVAAGDQGSATVSLESPGRYLVTVKAPGHKLWGKHFALPASSGGQVVVQLEKFPLKLGKLIVHAFHDRRPVNAAPDFIGEENGEPGLQGFEVRLHDTVGEIQADYNGDPLCGGVCLTNADGNVTIPNLAPGRYEIEVLPPDGTDWTQTTTFEGTHLIDFGRVTENDDGKGALDEAAVAAGTRTAWWFGFVQPMDLPGDCDPCGSISGTARTWVGWPHYSEIFFAEPIPTPTLALSDIGGSEAQVFTGFGQPDGSFSIGDIPDGTYTLSIFDQNLDWIIRYVTFTLPDPVTGSRDLDLNVEDVKGELGIPVARWFGRINGYVFEDNGLDAAGSPIPGAAADNGVRDCGPSNPDRCEEGIDGVDLDLRWRDGSVKAATFTAPHPETGAGGFYEYPEVLTAVPKFLISEVGFGRFARTGMSLHDEFAPSSVSPLPDGLGGGLLLNQLTMEGHTSWIDWGKREYVLDDPLTPEYDGEHGGITGIVFYATTRNEFDPALAGAEDYEPGIPSTTVKLWGPGPDLRRDTADDVLVNEVTTDAWSHPRSDHPDEPQSCDVRDAFGASLPPFNPDIAPSCLEFPGLSSETKDGAFDGGYAIETMLNHPITGAPTPSEPLLPPGDYVVEVVPPPFYQVIKEEDQNTDEGDELGPQITPPPCVGPLHLVNDPRNPADGREKPLCNKKLVTLDDGQNPAADFFLFTDVDDDPETNTAADGSWNTVESVAPPGRIFGYVGDDLRFDTDPASPWFGQPLALPNIPVGVYDYKGRLITMLHTDEHGLYDVVLPSTQTYNCPTPSGVCPGMYVLRIDDPADAAFNPDYLTAALAFDVWPGKTTYADTPVDPIAAVACNIGVLEEPNPNTGFVGFAFPELWRVDPNPYIQRTGTDAQRELTINGVGFGASRGSQGRVTLGGFALPTSAYLSWDNRQIRIRVPGAFIAAGPRQLLIRGSNGKTTPVGITIHVLGGTYTPTIVHVPEDHPTIQAAIDASSDNGLVVVHRGTYNESVIMHRRVKLQGVGPGGSVGAPENTSVDDIRFSVPGSVINGRNFFDREDAWNAKLASLPKPAGFGDVPGGADITVVPRTTSQFNTGRNAAIDGFGLILGQGAGAGGIQVNAFARNLEITDNIIESNGGEWGGAIALGLPSLFNIPAGQLLNASRLDNQNDDIRIAYNRILGNGGRMKAGGVAIYNGAERYVVERNDICSNYSNEYGGGISHFGRSGGQSPAGGARGRILGNRIFGNEAFDSGGGIMIAGEYPPGIEQEARGSGRVDIEQNFISGNLSNDDGGGIMLLDTLGSATSVVSRVGVGSNMITNNVATDVGGGMTIDDAHNVLVVNNTFARNSSTDTSEDRNFVPNGAGFVSEKNSLDAGFSVPVAFFNNIFWNNEAFTFDPSVDTGLASAGTIDIEVYGTPGVLDPRFSILTDGANTTSDPSNIVGEDPLFVAMYDSKILAGPARVTGEFQTTLIREDPQPPGADGLPGDYHLTAGSPALCAGVGTLSGFPRWSPDIDGQVRASGSAPPTVRPEIGGDEVPGAAGC